MIDIRGATTLLQVFDIDQSIRFYCDILGFAIKTRAECWAWLEREHADLMLNTAYDPDDQPDQPDPVRVAAHEDTIIYFGCPDVDGAYEFLASHGVAVDKPRVAHYGMKQLYIKDPDGFGICFQWRA